MAPLHPQPFHFLSCASCIPRHQHGHGKSVASCLTNPRLVNARDGVEDAADAVFWSSEARGSECGSGVATELPLVTAAGDGDCHFYILPFLIYEVLNR